MADTADIVNNAVNGLIDSIRRNADVNRSLQGQKLNLVNQDLARRLSQQNQIAGEQRAEQRQVASETRREALGNREFQRNKLEAEKERFGVGAENAETNARSLALQTGFQEIAPYDKILAAAIGQPNLFAQIAAMSAGGQKVDAAALGGIAGPLANLSNPVVKKALADRNAAIEALDARADYAGRLARNKFITRFSSLRDQLGLSKEFQVEELGSAPKFLPAEPGLLDVVSEPNHEAPQAPGMLKQPVKEPFGPAGQPPTVGQIGGEALQKALGATTEPSGFHSLSQQAVAGLSPEDLAVFETPEGAQALAQIGQKYGNMYQGAPEPEGSDIPQGLDQALAGPTPWISGLQEALAPRSIDLEQSRQAFGKPFVDMMRNELIREATRRRAAKP